MQNSKTQKPALEHSYNHAGKAMVFVLSPLEKVEPCAISALKVQ